MRKTLTWNVVIAVSCMAPLLTLAEVPLESRLLLGGTVEMLVPSAFQQMRQDILEFKYPLTRRPTVVLSNESGSVSLALNHTRDPFPSSRFHEAHAALEGMMRETYPTAQWFRSEVRTRNGRQFILLDVRTPAVDTEIRNLMVATSVDERLLLITVNMVEELEMEWLETANLMIESIVVHSPAKP